MDTLKPGEEMFKDIQEQIRAWENLLIATGGCLKPEECFWYLLNYNCVECIEEVADTSAERYLAIVDHQL